MGNAWRLKLLLGRYSTLEIAGDRQRTDAQ
jgi:hypothetical protein